MAGLVEETPLPFKTEIAMEKPVLVIIAAPLMGHLRQAVETAKLILQKTNKLSIQVLLMENPTDLDGTKHIKSIAAASTTDDLHFRHLPKPEDTSNWCSSGQEHYLYELIDFAKTHVRESVKKMKNLSGFIIDPICTTMIDIADEFGVPTYLFFTSGACFIGTMFYHLSLKDYENWEIPDDLLQNGTELFIPCFSNLVPVDVIPGIKQSKEAWNERYLQFARDYKRTKAIMVNTFSDLENFPLNSFTSNPSYCKSKLPPVHPIGPILSTGVIPTSSSEIMKWLDKQPPSSVVFLCFGSMGSLPVDQITELANGLEQSGFRFVWSFRQPPVSKEGFPSEFENQEEILPEGFLNRTKMIGKVTGWIQQMEVLSHISVGGFVSHCGWNSILESIWCGVPIGAWPIGGDQPLNAFQIVKELEIAVEICMDYHVRKEDNRLVKAEEIVEGIKRLMDNGEVRGRVKLLSEKSKEAVAEGGSSYLSFEHLINGMLLDRNLKV